MKPPVSWLVDFFEKLIRHEDRDYLLNAIINDIPVKDSHRKGLAFENLIDELCREQNLTSEKPSGSTRACDRIINGWRVQIKHIDREQNGRIAIDNMRPVKSNNNKRGYGSNEIDYVFVKHRGDIYMIPVHELIGKNGLLMQQIQPKNFARFINCWKPLVPKGPHGSGQMTIL